MLMDAAIERWIERPRNRTTLSFGEKRQSITRTEPNIRRPAPLRPARRSDGLCFPYPLLLASGHAEAHVVGPEPVKGSKALGAVR